MPTQDLIAEASTTIDAPAAKIWEALVTPASLKKFMFGSTIVSDFKKGSPITWSGEWKGKPYQDKGEIIDAQPGKRLAYTHFSPLAGKPDRPENYHRVAIELSPSGKGTAVRLTQDNNATEDERAHSAENWANMLDGLKKLLEQ